MSSSTGEQLQGLAPGFAQVDAGVGDHPLVVDTGVLSRLRQRGEPVGDLTEEIGVEIRAVAGALGLGTVDDADGAAWVEIKQRAPSTCCASGDGTSVPGS
ncbi:hypothetical protein [Blastococcus capsensis]|uniref:hypothetical protein n=1 Tax=Blastococcus capsensis TaxID=1564163 RepID=UPI00253FFBBF|nr:hypothetical protein [Blastococcus capsensis]MDK3254948.1 hypothetical protein [Blastococcus capsensis]